MALVKETGEGLSNSNSYASAADADAYFTDRGNTTWASYAVSQKEAALIRATDYIDANYIFRSVPLRPNQSLQCPRYGQWNVQLLATMGYSDGGIPIYENPDANLVPAMIKPVLVKATIELAMLLTVTDEFSAKPHPVSSESQQLDGVGHVQKVYSGRYGDPYPIVTGYLKTIASFRLGGASSSMMTS